MQKKDFEDLYETEEKMWWFVGMREISAALLDEHCRKDFRNILDVGCGTGINLKWLERYGEARAIKGLDIEPTALDFCRQRGTNLLTLSSATDLPFKDETFDLVTSFDVLVQTIGEGSDEQAMREMLRVLKPGGIAFVRAAAYKWMRSDHDKAVNSQRRYALGELSQKLEKAGFTVLRKTYTNTFLLPVAAIQRFILKPLRLTNQGSDVKPFPPSLAWLNRIFTKFLLLESAILKSGRILPFGLSAVCVVRKD